MAAHIQLIRSYGFLLFMVGLLGGCAVVTKPQSTSLPASSPLLVQPHIPEQMPAGSAFPAVPVPPDGSVVQAVPPEAKTGMSDNHAVIALLDLAQRDYAGGGPEAAGAAIERALRIEPRNPWLWHELAQLRLTQGQYARAITLAQKSNSFVGSERSLHALNWRLIGNALVAQGDTVRAEQAFGQAATLEQSDSGAVH